MMLKMCVAVDIHQIFIKLRNAVFSPPLTSVPMGVEVTVK